MSKRQDAIQALTPYANEKIADVYDELNFFYWAEILQPGFEYPDWDYRKVKELWQ